MLTIPHPREASFGGGGVTIEVFDEDFGEPIDFLGQVCYIHLRLERDAWLKAMSGNEHPPVGAVRCVISVLLRMKKPPPPTQCTVQAIISGEDLLRFHSPGTFKGVGALNRQVKLQNKPEVPFHLRKYLGFIPRDSNVVGAPFRPNK